jgi:DNA polymerase-4
VPLELPLGLGDEGRCHGTRKGLVRSRADQAIDAIRKRFGVEAVDYAVASPVGRSVRDEFDALLKESCEYRPWRRGMISKV